MYCLRHRPLVREIRALNEKDFSKMDDASSRIGRLIARSRIISAIRAFLDDRGYLEVETPCIVPAPGQDPHLRCFEVLSWDGTFAGYLRTSPEHAAKRLLASGLPRIYELSKVFRSEPHSDHHLPEFTMLEFYRAGAGTDDLKSELVELLRASLAAVSRGFDFDWCGKTIDLRARPVTIEIRDVIKEELGIDWEDWREIGPIMEAATAKGFEFPGNAWTQAQVFTKLMIEVVEPALPDDRIVFLEGYPASMASYAKLKNNDSRIADRFELYLGGVELANAFAELNDPVEQRARFETWIRERRADGGPDYPIDEEFLQDLASMPDAAGAALGVDRLVMLLTGAAELKDVVSFVPGHLSTRQEVTRK